MTPEAQRIAIAEACGWTFHEIKYAPVGGGAVFESFWLSSKFKIDEMDAEMIGQYAGFLPDYLNDLNAMHEAEKGLTPEQWATYHGHLADVSGFSHDDTMTTKEAETEWTHRVCHTTAAQRAEAFLRTLNLWTEQP